MQVPHKIVETFKICNRETSVYSIIVEGDNIKKGSNSLLIRTSSLVLVDEVDKVDIEFRAS